MTGNTPQSIIEKLWNSHHVLTDEGESLMYVDVALAQENTLHAFTELEKSGRKVARPQQIFAFTDHYVPTTGRAKGTDAIADLGIRNMVIDMQDMANKHGVTLFGMAHEHQGIMHIVPPEKGIIQPGVRDRQRFAYFHTRRFRLPRLRRRRLRIRACDGDADAVAKEAQGPAHHCRW